MNENTTESQPTPEPVQAHRLIASTPGKIGTPGRNPRKRYAWTKFDHRKNPPGSGHARRAARWVRRL